MTYDNVLQELRQNGNAKPCGFNNNIINSGVPAIGCTIPFVRQLAKRCSLAETANFPVHTFFEVDLLRGITVADCKLPFSQKSLLLAQFAYTIENWAVCDCSVVKVPRAERELYFALFCDMLASDKPFVCRYGTVNLLSNFLDSEHIDAVFAQLRAVTQWGSHYVDMGVAWLIATAMVKCREQTVLYMQTDGRRVLNKFTYNKALQKMRDSYRVSEADKQWTHSVKMI